jgi:hypothetical protein
VIGVSKENYNPMQTTQRDDADKSFFEPARQPETVFPFEPLDDLLTLCGQSRIDAELPNCFRLVVRHSGINMHLETTICHGCKKPYPTHTHFMQCLVLEVVLKAARKHLDKSVDELLSLTHEAVNGRTITLMCGTRFKLGNAPYGNHNEARQRILSQLEFERSKQTETPMKIR